MTSFPSSVDLSLRRQGWRALRIYVSGVAALLALHSLGAQDSSAQKTSSWALGAQAGTLGWGLKLDYTPSPKFAFELGYTFMDYDDEFEDDEGDTTYTGELDFSNIQALVRWHPWGGAFHLSAGAISADNAIDLIGQPSPGAVYEIGDETYTAAQVGQLLGHVEVADSIAPYVGLGWTKSSQTTGFGGFLNLGVMFSGSAQVDLDATGPIRNDPTFQENLRAEEESVQSDLDDFEIYPVVQAGLIWRF